MPDRDCDTCQHHSQVNLDPRCGDCFRSTLDFPMWEAKEKTMEYPVTKDGPCEACRFFSVHSTVDPCYSCGFGGNYYWQQRYVPIVPHIMGVDPSLARSDGSTADYYVLPAGATELQDIIAAHNMNAQMGEIGRAWVRYGRCPHSPRERDLKKIIFYAQAELDRLEKYGE
jgi:hypothetical protein